MKKYIIGSAFSLVLGLTAAFAAEDTFEFERGANKIKMTFQHSVKDSDDKIIEQGGEISPILGSSSSTTTKGLLGATAAEETKDIKTFTDMIQYCIDKPRSFTYTVKGQLTLLYFYYPESQTQDYIIGYQDLDKKSKTILLKTEISKIAINLG
jgi:hypothetical protein